MLRTRWWHAHRQASQVDAVTEGWPRIVRIEGTLSEAEASEIRQRIIDNLGCPQAILHTDGVTFRRRRRWFRR